MIEIHVQDAKAKQVLERAMSLKGAISSLLALVASDFQQEVQKNIRGQGSEYGVWVPASKWIIAKEGRSKLFPEASQYVRLQATSERASVVFQSPADWTLTQHQEGFTIPPTGEMVYLDLKMPSAIGLQRGQIAAFISRRPSRVPARRFWPSDERAKKKAEPLVEQWAKKLEAELVR